MLELTVPERDTGEARPPLSLALVIDRSGSMHGPKLAYAKRAAEWLIGRTRKILLLTDGLANEGITDPAALVRLATGARSEGIGTTTIRFGDGFHEDLLTAMADAGGGNSHYAASADAAPAIFASEFDELTRLWAQNLSVEIRPTEAVEVLGVLNEYPSVTVPDGIQVELGELPGAGARAVRVHKGYTAVPKWPSWS